MSKYRSELRVPVEHAKVRFADRVDSIPSDSTKYHTSLAGESYSSSKASSGQGLHSRPFHRIMLNNLNSSTDFSDSDTWFEDVRRRFDEQRRRWDDKVRRMRDDVFTLLPSDEDYYRGSSGGGGMQMLSRPFSSNIESRGDGSKQFVAHFDVSAFPPNSITVSVRDEELTIGAKVKEQGLGASRMREFTRTMNLPYGTDATLMNATLSSDQVLTVTCPLQPTKKRIRATHVIQSDPSDISDAESSSQSKDERETTTTATSIHSCSPAPSTSRSMVYPTKPKFCLELPVDPEYSPAEIQIRTLNNRIYINARHEERGGNRTAVKEFAKEYDIPDDVNPEDLQAKFDAGVLYINSTS